MKILMAFVFGTLMWGLMFNLTQGYFISTIFGMIALTLFLTIGECDENRTKRY